MAAAGYLFGGWGGGGVWYLACTLGARLGVRDLGLSERDLDRAAEIAVANPYENPRPIGREAIRGLLQRAWDGARPEN